MAAAERVKQQPAQGARPSRRGTEAAPCAHLGLVLAGGAEECLEQRPRLHHGPYAVPALGVACDEQRGRVGGHVDGSGEDLTATGQCLSKTGRQQAGMQVPAA